jgi:ABC-type metal ion transport system substrate-binding protein
VPSPGRFLEQHACEAGLVVSDKHLNDPNVQKLIETFKDPKIAEFLQTTDNKLIRDTLGPIGQ